MHTRVWEEKRQSFKYESPQWRGLIKKWEPNILDLELTEISIGLEFFKQKRDCDDPPYSSDEFLFGPYEENNISILSLAGVESTTKVTARTNNSTNNSLLIKCRFIGKLLKYSSEDKMLTLDKALLKAKRLELSDNFGSVSQTEHGPLAFTLELERFVDVIIEEFFKFGTYGNAWGDWGVLSKNMLYEVGLKPRLENAEIVTIDKYLAYKFIKRFYFIAENGEAEYWHSNTYYYTREIITLNESYYLIVSAKRGRDSCRIKLKSDFSLDSSWLKEHHVDIHRKESVESYEDSGGQLLPCDEDPADCGVTCFNCTIGNG